MPASFVCIRHHCRPPESWSAKQFGADREGSTMAKTELIQRVSGWLWSKWV